MSTIRDTYVAMERWFAMTYTKGALAHNIQYYHINTDNVALLSEPHWLCSTTFAIPTNYACLITCRWLRTPNCSHIHPQLQFTIIFQHVNALRSRFHANANPNANVQPSDNRRRRQTSWTSRQPMRILWKAISLAVCVFVPHFSRNNVVRPYVWITICLRKQHTESASSKYKHTPSKIVIATRGDCGVHFLRHFSREWRRCCCLGWFFYFSFYVYSHWPRSNTFHKANAWATSAINISGVPDISLDLWTCACLFMCVRVFYVHNNHRSTSRVANVISQFWRWKISNIYVDARVWFGHAIVVIISHPQRDLQWVCDALETFISRAICTAQILLILSVTLFGDRTDMLRQTLTSVEKVDKNRVMNIPTLCRYSYKYDRSKSFRTDILIEKKHKKTGIKTEKNPISSMS